MPGGILVGKPEEQKLEGCLILTWKALDFAYLCVNVFIIQYEISYDSFQNINLVVD